MPQGRTGAWGGCRLNAAVPGGDPAPPAFGEADLSNCEREQIQYAASIQPHGAILVVREPELLVLQASANAAAFLGLPPGSLAGRALDAIPGDLAARIRPHLGDPLNAIPAAVRCAIGPSAAPHDALIHRPACGAGLVVELERAGPALDVSRQVERALQAILGAWTMRGLCDEAARLFRDLTGYDRVMVYRFDDDGHGEVVAEERLAELEPYLGNRYPASDIPQIARRLYEHNRVRVVVDVGYAPVPLEPRLSPDTGAELDMSLCVMRSISPLHIQYLQNMGVGATLVTSIMVGGRLWGLVSCHHYAARIAGFRMRAICELLAEALGTRIAALESFAQAQAELAVRRLEQRLIEAISREGDWRAALFDNPEALLQPLGATGAALLFEGQIRTAGEAPSTSALRDLGAFLDDRRPRSALYATSALAQQAPRFAGLTPVASGLVAVPVSSSPGEYLIWFRPEQVRTVTWGGDPTKPMIIGDDPAQLSPRRSFAQWHQVVEGTGEPWTPRDLTAARLIGDTVADVVLQFRSVRLLIAQDQLAQVRRQVGLSDQPVVIADELGLVQMTNEAFDRLLPPGLLPGAPRALDDLLPLFVDGAETAARLREVVGGRRSWRGEVRLQPAADGAEERPMLVRADPVFSAPDRVLGFVLLFTDLSGRKRAEAARRRFQEGIVQGHRVRPGRLDTEADLAFRNLLNTVVENAQLAALEITDGVEVAQMPRMLDSIRASVTRTAEVLEHLLRHAGRGDHGGGRG
jgi:light-regulated signal transduction histidine kinase (bacteriophytochrome)